MGEFNIAPNTQIGRIDIEEKVYEHENVYGLDKYSRGGEFIENMVTDNVIEFCKRWFGLAGIMEFVQDMKEYEAKFMYGASYHQFKNLEAGLKENPIYDLEGGVEKAVVVGDDEARAILFFGSLKQNKLSSDFERIKAGCIGLDDEEVG
jgi:hypothetical protein